MNDLRKAAEMALKALEHIDWEDQSLSQVEAKEALRQALSQPEQEPVAYTGNGTAGREADVRPTGFFFQMPKREWVGLTNADKQEAFDETQEASGGFWEFADYLEAKLKEKNT